MRRFMISSLSLRRLAYHRHVIKGGYAFSGSPPRVSDRAVPPQDDGQILRWLMNMEKRPRFMSTQTNPPHTNVSSNEKDAIEIKVISREHIKPWYPTPEKLRYYKLSFFDQIEAPIYHPLMFFYQGHNNNNRKSIEDVILERSNHLKQSLSETLTRMHPFAGKLASELHVDCNDVGVYYVETRVDDQLNNLLKEPDNKFLKRLIPIVDSVPNQPLVGCYVSMVQVNFFNCGGVSITIQHNHKFADARSTMIFMNTWAAIARRDTNQVYPNFVSSSMFPQNPKLAFSPLWYLTISSAYIKHGKSSTTRFVFNALALKELKAKASKHQPVSRVVAVLALLWKCASIESTQSKPSLLHMPVDIRQQFSPLLPDYSIGNIKSGAVARFDPSASNLDVASMASRIKNAISDSISESFEELKGVNGHVKFVESLRNSMELFSDFKTEYHLTTSLCNSGSKEADFGWGKPVWFCTGNHLNEDVPLFTNRVILVDSSSGDGIEAWVTLEKQVMDGVKCNAELLSYASVNPSPL
ncbi:putative vinorine synthase [Helianthus annuus]|nr:putative vinorine synthase [Helianthus annuus]KAJ0851048.1 putative vinorine synthase [Helianthus annuus]